jgi:hypothetical protein
MQGGGMVVRDRVAPSATGTRATPGRRAIPEGT